MNGQVVPPVYTTPVGSVSPNFLHKPGPVKFAHATPPAMGSAAMPIAASLGAAYNKHKQTVTRTSASYGKSGASITQGMSGMNGYSC
jgi:hypothetical protein